jgi:hypothetical protein
MMREDYCCRVRRGRGLIVTLRRGMVLTRQRLVRYRRV